jgi:hypothetical protein
MANHNRLLISVDVEEFDIPEEFGGQVSPTEKLAVSHTGVLQVLELFALYKVRATFFITAYWAEHFPELVQQIALEHEIASHAYYHHTFQPADLEASRLALEKISGQPVTGFRMPRLQPVDLDELRMAGYRYDASLNPTWLPGRYNNWHRPRTPFKENGIWVVPSAVSPICRYPVFWLSVKNAPLWMSRHFSKTILKRDGLLSFYFHPWELTPLDQYTLPAYIRHVSGVKMQQKLAAFLHFLKKNGKFYTHRQLLNEIGGE